MSYGLEIRNAAGAVTFSTERWCLLLVDIVFATWLTTDSFYIDYPECQGCTLEMHVDPYYATVFQISYNAGVPRLTYTQPGLTYVSSIEQAFIAFQCELYIVALPI